MMPNDTEQRDENSRSLAKFDREILKGIVPANGGTSRAIFLPANFGEALEMAKLLASGIGVRPFMRGNVSACMMIVQQSVRWGMDPYAVANKAYLVDDQVSYESQLIAALVNTSPEIIGRLKVAWEGDVTGGIGKETLVCTVRGRLRDDPDEERELSQPLKDVTIRRSPLWKVNPRLQLAYHTQRSWARLYVPEVLLGIYSPDELEDGQAAAQEEKTRPATAAAPDRRAFAAEEPIDATFTEVSEEKHENDDSDRTEPQSEAATAASDEQTGDSGPAEAETGPEQSNLTPDERENGVAKADSQPEMDLDEVVDNEAVPQNEKDWGSWERETRRDIAACGNMDALQKLRRFKQPVLDAAPAPIMNVVQDAFADQVVELTGE